MSVLESLLWQHCEDWILEARVGKKGDKDESRKDVNFLLYFIFFAKEDSLCANIHCQSSSFCTSATAIVWPLTEEWCRSTPGN